jgi:hypothetical protein
MFLLNFVIARNGPVYTGIPYRDFFCSWILYRHLYIYELLATHACCIPSLSHPPFFVNLSIISWLAQIMKLIVMKFSTVYYFFICPISRYSPHNPVPKHSQRLLFLPCERPSFAPIIFIYCCDGVRLCLWNWTANRTTVCPPDDTWMSRSIGETCYSDTLSTKNLTSWTRASVARSRRLTTWAMSRSVFIPIQNRIQECLKRDETWNTCQNPCVWKLH